MVLGPSLLLLMCLMGRAVFTSSLSHWWSLGLIDAMMLAGSSRVKVIGLLQTSVHLHFELCTLTSTLALLPPALVLEG